MSVLKQCLFAGLRPLTRSFASSTSMVNVNVDNKGIATVELNRPPVNSMNYELLEEMHRTFVQLETDRCKGMILTSTSPTVFSAGLDIMEMYKPTVDKARRFWGMLQNMWIKLYSTPYPTVAAMNGHSPAGGCLLGLSCEYRIIVPKVKIGLNETQLGIIAPQWFQDCMRNVIGDRQAEKALIAGTMFSSEDALKVGLVDEIATDKEDCLKRAHQFLAGQVNLPNFARNKIKMDLRKKTLDRMLEEKAKDDVSGEAISFVLQPEVQNALGAYLEGLNKKKEAKKLRC